MVEASAGGHAEPGLIGEAKREAFDRFVRPFELLVPPFHEDGDRLRAGAKRDAEALGTRRLDADESLAAFDAEGRGISGFSSMSSIGPTMLEGYPGHSPTEDGAPPPQRCGAGRRS